MVSKFEILGKNTSEMLKFEKKFHAVKKKLLSVNILAQIMISKSCDNMHNVHDNLV